MSIHEGTTYFLEFLENICTSPEFEGFTPIW